jgi:hypothetical protein
MQEANKADTLKFSEEMLCQRALLLPRLACIQCLPMMIDFLPLTKIEMSIVAK